MASAQIVTIEGIAGFDPLMDVRSGSCNGTIIGCSEIGVESKSILVLSGLSIGNTYYVRVYSSSYYPEHQGTFTICVQNPAVNDDCAGAINLSSSTSCTPTAGTTVSATQSLAGADCTGDLNNADDDVWYKFIAIATTHTVIVQGTEGVFDAMVEVRAGPCNGNVIACADATAELGIETLALSNLTIGNTYYVRVYSWDKYSYSRGSFTICVTHPCATNLAISAPITSGTVIREAIKVTANNKVSGGTVTYRAPQSVILQPGFTATTSAGTFFQAMIGGCQ